MALVVQHPKIAQQSQKNLIEMPIADSSYLQHVSYDPANLQMTVIMKSGGQYVYSQISPNIMEEMIKAPSKGKFYADQIRGLSEATRTIDKTVGPAVSKKP